MRKLLEYMNSLDVGARAAFISACDTSESYLRKAASIGQKLNPETCVRIEIESTGAVTRRDLRPDDWEKIWPELRVPVPQPAEAAS